MREEEERGKVRGRVRIKEQGRVRREREWRGGQEDREWKDMLEEGVEGIVES